jgi:hypothetical protein
LGHEVPALAGIAGAVQIGSVIAWHFMSDHEARWCFKQSRFGLNYRRNIPTPWRDRARRIRIVVPQVEVTSELPLVLADRCAMPAQKNSTKIVDFGCTTARCHGARE